MTGEIISFFLFSFQANIQILQLADVVPGTDRMHGHVFSYQPNILVGSHYCHALANNSPPFPVFPHTLGSNQPGTNLPPSQEISFDVGYTKVTCEVLASADSSHGFKSATKL